MADETSKNWFVDWTNILKCGYSGEPHEILRRLESEWCITDSRRGAWAYCVKHYCGCFPVFGDNGKLLRYQKAVTDEEKALVPPDLHHVHMVLEDDVTMRFSIIRKTYAPGAHYEPLKGTKKQALDYIAKVGDYSDEWNKKNGFPYEEIIGSVLFHGEIQGNQGQRNDIKEAERMIRAERKKPQDVFDISMKMQRYESEIVADYLRLRDRETPEKRDLEVVWHLGPSQSGKSFIRVQLAEEYGRDEVFVLTKFDERGMFDGYYGQKILILDEFKGGIPYSTLLTWTIGYKEKLPARRRDRLSLWTQVHITSIYHPRAVYRKMVKECDELLDPVEQLINRISFIRYHYRTGPLGSTNPEDYGYIDFPRTATMAEMEDVVTKKIKYGYDIPQNMITLHDNEPLPF